MLYRLINLDRHPERLAAFQAAHPLLPVERHRGVDGAAVDRARLLRHGVISAGLDYTDAALGRALSHLVQWRDAIETDQPLTVIEDAAVLAPNFREEVERVLDALPADWEFVLWGQDSTSVLFEVSPGVLSRVEIDAGATNAAFVAGFSDRLATTRPFRMHAGTGAVAYSISVKGAWRLQDALLPLRPMTVRDLAHDRSMRNDGLDVMLARAWPMISAWVCFPPIAMTHTDVATPQEAATVPTPVLTRPTVASFDLFDTLVARRCVEPQGVFRIMAERLGLPGFPAVRSEAERRLMEGDFTLADVYRNVAEMLSLPEVQARAMMQTEIEVELEQLIPIRQTVATVRPQDVIVSDMYLGEDVLRRILRERLGLFHNQVFVSCHGKRNGTVWPALLEHYAIERHVGDNPLTDVRSPGAFGVPTELVSVSAPSAFEQAVDRAGLGGLARAMRECRLTARFADPAEQALKAAQSQANLPFLFITGLHLVEQVRLHGHDRLLLSGRDCHKLSLLLPRMLERAGLACDVTYFHSSRLLRCQASPAYLRYFNELRQGMRRTMVVDLCGSGLSLQCLLAAAGEVEGQTDLFLAHHRPENPVGTHYEHLVPARLTEVTAMLQGGSYNQDCLEILNTTDHPMVEDVATVAGRSVPVYFDNGYDAPTRAIVTAQHEEFLRCLHILFAHHEPEVIRPGPAVQGAAKAIYGAMSAFWLDAFRSLVEKHFRDNAVVVGRIGGLGTTRRARDVAADGAQAGGAPWNVAREEVAHAAPAAMALAPC